MDDELDFQQPRPRDPMYRRRQTPLEAQDDDTLVMGDGFDTVDPIDDTSVDIFYLLDRLEELMSVGKRVPFSGRVMVEEDEFLALVDQLRVAVPNEIKQAQRVIRERRAIIEESHEEAARILDAARRRADYFVSQEGILNEAKLKSEQILQDAVKVRNETFGAIDAYALEQFDRVEQAMRDGLAVIDESLEDAVNLMRDARGSIGR
jgi:hypothetical protein